MVIKFGGVGSQMTEIDTLVYMWGGKFCDLENTALHLWNSTT